LISGEPLPLVLTGASGFIGRRILQRLAREAAAFPQPRSVTLLVRDATSLGSLDTLPEHWRVVPWDLASGEPLPAGAVPAGSVIIHLAAATGRSAAATMRAVNLGGTERIVAAAAVAGARHLVFVSSIAAGFANRRWYPYAEAKRAAEQVVRHGAVPATVVRPTMVFGPGSPVQEGLERLAMGRAPIILGRGTVRVQPIHVDDLAATLLALADAAPSGARAIEVGGGDQLTMRELLTRMRAVRGLPARTLWSVPLGLPRLALAMAEQVPGLRLPVTAGQLASFLNDSVAEPHPATSGSLPRARGIAEILPAAPGHPIAEAGEPAREFAVFARYLGTAVPGPQAEAAYLRAEPMAAALAGDGVDRLLIGLARRSVAGCGVADAYARLARPHGPLRRRLVLTLAVLESTAGIHTAYDTARPSGTLTAWLAIGARGIRWLLRTGIAVLALAPFHIMVKLAAPRARHG